MSAYGRKVSKESHNQCLCKCCRHCQVTSPGCWKSNTSKGWMDLLPVEYCSQNNTWMSSKIFHAWFHHSFIPTVCKELSSLGLEPKDVLVIALPTPMKNFISNDGNITTLYLPLNVTPLIQLINQGVRTCGTQALLQEIVTKATDRRWEWCISHRLPEYESCHGADRGVMGWNQGIYAIQVMEKDYAYSITKAGWRDQTEGQEDGDEDVEEGYSMDEQWFQ